MIEFFIDRPASHLQGRFLASEFCQVGETPKLSQNVAAHVFFRPKSIFILLLDNHEILILFDNHEFLTLMGDPAFRVDGGCGGSSLPLIKSDKITL